MVFIHVSIIKLTGESKSVCGKNRYAVFDIQDYLGNRFSLLLTIRPISEYFFLQGGQFNALRLSGIFFGVTGTHLFFLVILSSPSFIPENGTR